MSEERWYISGPVSSYAASAADREHAMAINLEIFRDADRLLRAAGHVIAINPADYIADYGASHADYMRCSYRSLVTHCNALVLLPGWRDSRGAQAERHAALMCGMRVAELHELVGTT